MKKENTSRKSEGWSFRSLFSRTKKYENKNSGSNNDSQSFVRKNVAEKIEEFHPNSNFQYDDENVTRVRSSKNYYEVLGVTKNSSTPEIHAAYKKLARKLHPDKNSSPGAREAFNILKRTETILSDPEARERYDLFGTEDPTSAEFYTSIRKMGSESFERFRMDERNREEKYKNEKKNFELRKAKQDKILLFSLIVIAIIYIFYNVITNSFFK